MKKMITTFMVIFFITITSIADADAGSIQRYSVEIGAQPDGGILGKSLGVLSNAGLGYALGSLHSSDAARSEALKYGRQSFDFYNRVERHTVVRQLRDGRLVVVESNRAPLATGTGDMRESHNRHPQHNFNHCAGVPPHLMNACLNPPSRYNNPRGWRGRR